MSVRLRVDGESLVLESPVAPPREILDGLARFKTEILAMLRPGPDGWSAEDWRAFFDERAGFAEHDAGLPRSEAEARAFACCVAEWENRNFVSSRPGRCVSCGRADHREDRLVPFGTEGTGHVWLHDGCRGAWQAASDSRAITALRGMGVGKATELPVDFEKAGGG